MVCGRSGNGWKIARARVAWAIAVVLLAWFTGEARAAGYRTVNFIVDLVYARLDPRIQAEG